MSNNRSRHGKSWDKPYNRTGDSVMATDDERLRVLAQADPPLSAERIARILERGIPAVQNRASVLGLSLATKNDRYSEAEIRVFLTALHAGATIRAAADLIGRPGARWWLYNHGLSVGDVRADLDAALKKVGVEPSTARQADGRRPM